MTYDIQAKNNIAFFKLDGLQTDRGVQRVVPSKDGKALFVKYTGDGDGFAQVVSKFDAHTGKVINRVNINSRSYLGLWMVEADDGKLLLDFHELEKSGVNTFGVLAVDMDSGTTERFEHTDTSKAAAILSMQGLSNPSPDGRYWLKWERNQLPVRDVPKKGLSGLLGSKTRYYGVTFQLWEVRPMKFVRQITAAWLDIRALYGIQVSPFAYPHLNEESGDWFSEEVTQMRWARLNALIDDILRGCAKANAGPTDPVNWPEIDDAFKPINSAYDGADEFWYNYFRSAAARVFFWQPDSEAFWIVTKQHCSRATVDGQVSPRLKLARHKTDKFGTARVEYPETINILPANDGTALVEYPRGTAKLNGSPSAAPHEVVNVSERNDHWQERDHQAADALKLRVDALKAEAKKTLIPLSSLEEIDCIAAIEQLSDIVTNSLEERVVDNEFRAVFKLGKKQLDEARFFSHVRDSCPSCAPALQTLIEACTKHGSSHIFWKSSPAASMLCHAALTLGLLDQDRLRVVIRYLQVVDSEHEGFFSTQAAPQILSHHGWTRQTLEFAFMFMCHTSMNSGIAPDFWSQSGIRTAAPAMVSAEEFAEFSHEALERYGYPAEEESEFGHWLISEIAEELPSRDVTRWDREFFDAFRELARPKRTEGGESWVG